MFQKKRSFQKLHNGSSLPAILGEQLWLMEEAVSFHCPDLVLPLQASLGCCSHSGVSKGGAGMTWPPLRGMQSNHMLEIRWVVLGLYEIRLSKSLVFKLFFFHLALKYPFLKQWFWC